MLDACYLTNNIIKIKLFLCYSVLCFMPCLVSGWCFTLRGSVFYPLDWRALGLLVYTELCLHSFCCTGTPLCLHKGEQLGKLKTHNIGS